METKKKTSEKVSLFNKWTGILLAADVVFFILGILDLSGAVNFSPFNGLFYIFAASLILITVFYILYLKFKKSVFKFMMITVLIAGLLEGTVFQFTTYSTLIMKEGTYSVTPSTASPAGATQTLADGSVSVTGKQTVTLSMKSLNRRVDTITADVDFSGDCKLVNVSVDASDESHYTLREGVGNAKIAVDCPSSNCIKMHLNGKVTDLNLKFTGTSDSGTFKIKSIDFNKAKPFDVLFIRWVFLILLGGLIYCVFVSKSLKNSFDAEKKKFILVSCAAVFVALTFMFNTVSYKLPDGGFSKDFSNPATNQISKEIVDAFEQGQVNLLQEPTDGFKALSNPYDWSLRRLKNEEGAWDHVYYNGKYYSYYGVAPVLTLFLPYHMVTSHYFPTDVAILIFSAIGIFFLFLTYFEIIKRFFSKIPANIALSGFIVMLASCGAFYMTGRTLFYEISISSGFMFTTLGAYLMFSSGIMDGGKIRKIRLILSSLFFGLAVMSRPTLAVYAVCAAGFFIYRIVLDFRAKNKGAFLTLICAGLPMFCCAVFQMWYNMARFGSPLDFGISYSVTINDFTKNDFGLIYVVISLFAYLFTAPIISPTYPFIRSDLNKLNANGYYFNDVGTIAGMIFIATPVLGYVFGGKALKKLPEKKDRIKYGIMVGVPCLLMPLVIICSIWESGYAIRYFADFAWEMLAGALIILFFLYLKSENDYKKKLFAKLMAAAAVAAVVINAIYIFNFTFEADKYPEAAYLLERMISFWV